MSVPLRLSVRGIPVNDHKYRYRCGMPWGKEAVEVVVIDEPKAGQIPIQISPVQYAELQSDPHIAVSAVGEPGADAGELTMAKAQIIQLTAELARARKEMAGMVEDHKASSTAMIAEAERTGAKVAGLENDLAGLRAQIASKSKAR